MKKFISIFFIVTFNYFYSQEITEITLPKNNKNELLNKLEKSYKKNDTLSLVKFLKDWNEIIKPENFEGNSIENKTIYEIYNTFYMPNNPIKLGNWEGINLPEDSLKFLIIQKNIYFSILPDNDFENFNSKTYKIDSIINFKPSIHNLIQEKILYLTPEYDNVLNKFLGSKYIDYETGKIIETKFSKKEQEKKYNFLKKYIHIIKGHWGNYYHLETHPKINIILLNKEQNKAKVIFRYGYQGGETILEKKDNKWVIISSKATWIE